MRTAVRGVARHGTGRYATPGGGSRAEIFIAQRRGAAGRLAAILAVGLVLAGALAASAIAFGSPTGNRAAIAFYRVAAARNNSVAIESFVRRGYMSYYAVVGQRPSFGYVYARATVPRGYVRATEHLTLAQRHGRIVWASDVLTPPPCHGLCDQFPIELVGEASGRFGRFLKAGSASRCWSALRPGSSLPFGVGNVNFAVFGHFLPLLRSRGTVIARSVYRWSRTQTAQEADRFAAASKLWQGTVVHVSGGRGSPAFTFTDTQVLSSSRYQGPPQTTPLCGS